MSAHRPTGGTERGPHPFGSFYLTEDDRKPYSDAVDFSVLGPLRVEGPDGTIEIRGAKERLLLARLLSAGGRMVPAGDLITTLWGEEPPASAAKSLQTFVLRLRNALEPDRRGTPTLLLTEGPGYRLATGTGRVDAERFARLAGIGERALADGRPEQAADTITEALALWRGPAYAGFEDAPFAAAEARSLEELRLGATEARLSAQLALGDVGAAVPELERLVTEHPLREQAWEMLVTALYRSGRQGDALGAYERARAVLADELGVDPGPGLRALHARVLAHDPSLALPTVKSALPPELRPARELVGRTSELDQLQQAWRDAVRGESRMIVVRGPAGGGGSALAAAFAAEAAREGAVVRFLSATTRPDAADVIAGAGTRPVLVVADHVDSDLPASLTIRLAGRLGSVPAGAEVLELGPLGPDAVRKIVADYVPSEEASCVAEQILARTGGWPGAVHDAALDLARSRAVERVGVAAGVAESTGAELARVRAELADGVELLRDTDTSPLSADPALCPWRGLASYAVEDGPWFAGRERLVAELVAALAASRVLALVGSSGSGKSSVLRAGLLAALAADALPGSASWRVVTLRPGDHPLRELARSALGRTGRDEVADLLAHLVSAPSGDGAGRVVVAIDQFEEVWTVCADDTERRQFLDALCELATDPRSPVSVVIAVRADFMGLLAEHEGLRGLIGDGTVLVGPMTPPEVRRAIERPAVTGGLVLDDGLADTIVSDAGDEPGLLPLLSATMTQLWEQRDGRALTYTAYVGLGGLSGSIAALAEETYAALSPSRQDTARLVLLRLTGSGDGAGVTRRRVSWDEVTALPRPDVPEVIEALSLGRLLTVSEGFVEVAHEALFREWPRLRSWLVEDASGRAVQRRLAVAAAEWDAEGREASALWSGTRLASGLEVAEARPDEITPVEREFLDAGREAVDAERRAAEERAVSTARQNRRLRRLVAGIGVVLVLALVAGLLAWRAQREAQAASVSAEAKGLAASALNIEYPDVALLAAVESTKLEQSPETYGALLTLLARQPQVAHRVRTENRFLRIAASPDGGTVFVTENFPFIRAIDAATGETLWNVETPTGGQARQPTVTADGRGVIVPETGPDPGLIRLDAETGELEWEIRDLDELVPGSGRYVGNGALRSDGAYLASGETHVLTVDPETGEVTDAVPWPENIFLSPEYFVVWPEGRVSAMVDETDTSIVFDLDAPERGATELAGVTASISPDGRHVILLDGDDSGTTVRIVPTADVGADAPSVRVSSDVRGAPWSPDGTQVALTVDRGIQLLDPETLRLGRPSEGHSGAIMDARFAGDDGDVVWTAGRDGTAVAFDLSGRRTPVAVERTELEPDLGGSSHSAQRGVYLHHVWTGTPHTVHVVDLARGTELGELVPVIDADARDLPPDTIFEPNSVAITPDGGTVVTGVDGFTWADGYLPDQGHVAIFDADTLSQEALVETPWQVHSVATSPDGRQAVVNGVGGFATIDLETAEFVHGPTPLEDAWTIDGTAATQVSPDGRLAALARSDEIVLVDLASGQVVRRGAVASADDQLVQAIAWSADSGTIAAGADDGRLHVVSADTLAPIAPSRLITGGWVLDLEVAPDGRTMASIGSDGDVTLWDTATWRPYGQPVADDRGWGWLTFTRDDGDLRTYFESGEAIQVSVDPAVWVAAACQAAGRNLTAEESAVILPERPLQPTCPDPR